MKALILASLLAAGSAAAQDRPAAPAPAAPAAAPAPSVSIEQAYKREYAFLEYLARHSGRVVSRAEITEHVWDENHDPMSNVLDVYLSRLRRKVDGGEATPLLHTRRGEGIILAALSGDAATEVTPPSASGP